MSSQSPVMLLSGPNSWTQNGACSCPRIRCFLFLEWPARPLCLCASGPWPFNLTSRNECEVLPSRSSQRRLRSVSLYKTSADVPSETPGRSQRPPQPGFTRGHVSTTTPPSTVRHHCGSSGQYRVNRPPATVSQVCSRTNHTCLLAALSPAPSTSAALRSKVPKCSRHQARSPFPSDPTGLGPTSRSFLLPICIPFCHLGLKVSKLAMSCLS